ncbi:MAG: DUF1254 domain-containing protein [Pseudomonadales bacterium]|nr:DUF1254 domain-containing protein [Pseudomonadales bacterium]MCP5191467.1 DUF1254 domain-containing protein [Pseudomonadales bacterium]
MKVPHPGKRFSLAHLTRVFVLPVILVLAITSVASGTEHSTIPLDDSELHKIAEEGFIYGLPIVMNYAVMYSYAVDRDSGEFKAPFNQIKNEARVYTYKDTTIISPNSDTPYSIAWLDLRAEPIVLSVPAVERSRYYSVQLLDGNTFNFGFIGSRTNGNKPGNYMIVGPDWQGETPAGIAKVFRSTTDFPVAFYRTQLFNPADLPKVEQVQAGYKVKTVSAYLDKPAPPSAPPVDFPEIDSDQLHTRFFEYLAFALQFAPPGREEKAIRNRLARLGVNSDGTFNPKALSPEQRTALTEAMKAGEEHIDHYLNTALTNVSGWTIGSLWGDREFFNGDWLKRAAGAKAGIYGIDVVEATYPFTRVDTTGLPLDGSKSNYTLTFPAGQLPPVNAFWSITMYYGKTQLLIENPINRYLINSPMLPAMKKNSDGSLTIYIQHDSPDVDKVSNWLPAPDGPSYLVMRLYWPRIDAPSVLPLGEASWEPPGIVAAN